MTYARSHIVDAHNPGFYHLVSRCVRRAWLCGFDRLSGRSFEHRRTWIEQRLELLCKAFAVELYAYAILSNHYHLVLRLDPQAPLHWPDETVAKRWVMVSDAGDESSRNARIQAIVQSPERLALYRERLGSLSWFMARLNEYVARAANREDECSGRFWEGRFKSYALLDETAVYACMAYVDLNPVRAGLCTHIEKAKYTSAARRCADLRRQPHTHDSLTPIASGLGRTASSLAWTTRDYLALVQWTALRHTSTAQTAHTPLSALRACGLSPDAWWAEVHRYRLKGRRAFGSATALKALAARIGQHWLAGCAHPAPVPGTA